MTRLPAEARRRQLLEVAARRFADSGYRGTTTARLAEAAGITPPILYRHFESKLALFCALLDESAKQTEAAWRRAVSTEREPAARRRALVEAVAAGGSPSARRLLVRGLAETEPGAAGAARRGLKRLTAYVAAEIRTLQSAGAARREVGAAELARRLLAASIGESVTAAKASSDASWLEAIIR